MKFHYINKIILFFNICFNFVLATLLSPLNNSSLNYIHINFQWEQIPNVEEYQFQLFHSFNEDYPLLDTLVSNIYFYEKSLIDWSNSYYWRVKTINDSKPSSWTENYYFEIRVQKFNPEIIIEPQNSTEFGEGFYLAGISNWTGGSAQFNASCIINQNGREIWNDGDLNVFVNYINSSGDMFGGQDVDWVFNAGIEFNMQGDILWEEPYNFNLDPHDLKQLPNGNYMGFKHELVEGPIPIGNWTEQFQNIGYVADGIANEIDWVGQKLIEINPDTEEIVWSWNPFEYFNYDEFDSIGGTWNYVINSGRSYYDWLHSNAFHFDKHQNEIYISQRHLSRITKIDYLTGDVVWVLGPSHEYLNYGDNHICTDIGFSWQHNIQLLENGNLLLFDNGNLSHHIRDITSPVSRGLEISINDENECDIVWEFDLPPDLLTLGRGGIQKLENGNYLIAAGNDNMLEVSKTGEIIWMADLNTIAIYRGFKIPSLFPEAFSVQFENLSELPFRKLSNFFIMDNFLEFQLTNLSGYSNEYSYSISTENNENILNDTLQLLPNEKRYQTIEFGDDYFNNYDNFNIEFYLTNFPNSIKKYSFNLVKNNELNKNKLNIISNFPNPFNAETDILFHIPKDSKIQLNINNLLGQNVYHLSGYFESGIHLTKWESNQNSTGIYIINLETQGMSHSKSIMLLK